MNTHTVPVVIEAPRSDACPYCGKVDPQPETHLRAGRCAAEQPQRRIPEWVQRAQAGLLVRKDMTGAVTA